MTNKVLYRFDPFCVAASMVTTVAAVGMLKPNKAKVLVAELQGVNSEVLGTLDISFDGSNDMDMIINYNIQGAPKNCRNCIVSIHQNRACSDLGRHYFKGKEIHNPWKQHRNIIVTDDNGYGNSRDADSTIPVPLRIDGGNGINIDDNNEHVVAIYEENAGKYVRSRNRNAVVACGVLHELHSQPKIFANL